MAVSHRRSSPALSWPWPSPASRDRAAWNAFVESHPDAHRLSRMGMARRLRRVRSGTSACISSRAARAAIEGVLPLVRDQQPAVRPDADVAALSSTMAACSPDIGRRRIRAARSGRGRLPANEAAGTSSCGTSPGSSKICRSNSTRSRCACRSQLGMWDRLDRKVRNQVRKAEKSDLTLVRGGAELRRRVLRGVQPEHARPGHAGLWTGVCSRKSCALSRAGQSCSSSG